jgi:hypothetical protein
MATAVDVLDNASWLPYRERDNLAQCLVGHHLSTINMWWPSLLASSTMEPRRRHGQAGNDFYSRRRISTLKYNWSDPFPIIQVMTSELKLPPGTNMKQVM